MGWWVWEAVVRRVKRGWNGGWEEEGGSGGVEGEVGMVVWGRGLGEVHMVRGGDVGRFVCRG